MHTAFLALFASVALALPSKRFDGITVKVTGPSSVSSLDDLKFVAAVTNTGSEAVKVFKYGTVLDNLPTRSFEVTKDGKEVTFTGVKIQVELVDDAFTTIQSGETVKVEHNVASLFDFESAGAGSFSFSPKTSFDVVGTEAEISAATASKFEKVPAVADTLTVNISGNLAKREMPLNKRARNICTNTSQASFISTSYSEAKSLASLGSSYVTSRGTTDTLYRSYWGANAASRVTSVLNAVASESSTTRTLSCTDSFGVCTGGVIAYTVTSTTNVYFCSIFFNEVTTSRLCSGTSVASRNIRGGTVLHELTHALSRTNDVTYGCANDIALSDSQAIVNADNYNCFVTQVYANTQC